MLEKTQYLVPKIFQNAGFNSQKSELKVQKFNLNVQKSSLEVQCRKSRIPVPVAQRASAFLTASSPGPEPGGIHPPGKGETPPGKRLRRYGRRSLT